RDVQVAAVQGTCEDARAARAAASQNRAGDREGSRSMAHLTPEELARLVDEAPLPGERHHLEACDLCAAELASYREQTSALAALPAVRPPRGDWEALEARLVAEGLIDAGTRSGSPRLAVTPWW